MNIQEKLEEIKRQPEHIRMRYVLASVFISMIFVLVVWIISLKQNFKTIQGNPQVNKVMQDVSFDGTVEDLKKQKDAFMEGLSQNPLSEESK